MWPMALETDPVRAILQRAGTLETSSMRLFGLPESEIAQTLRDVEAAGLELGELEITTCLRRAELEIDIRYRPESSARAQELFAAIRERHERFVTADDGRSTDEQIAELLEGRRLALAESCTAGLLAARITDRPGSSAYFAGGVVSYSDEAKSELLGVPSQILAEHGAVSPESAEAMARGALERFGADVACAITGIAGPDGGTEQKPVGYVCFHVRDADGASLVRDVVLPGRRSDIRDRSVVVAMHMLRRLLLGEELPV